MSEYEDTEIGSAHDKKDSIPSKGNTVIAKLEKERIQDILRTPLSKLREMNDSDIITPRINAITKRPTVNINAKTLSYIDSKGLLTVMDNKDSLILQLTGKTKEQLEIENKKAGISNDKQASIDLMDELEFN